MPMSRSKIKKQNNSRSSYLTLKIYLWSLAAFIGSLIFGVGLILVLLGPMAGWLVLVYRIPLTLLLAVLAICNVIFLIYQIIKHRPSGILWIASIVTIVVSAVFVVWVSVGVVRESNDQKAYEQQSQAVDNRLDEEYARREEVAKPREVSVDEARRLLDNCVVFGFYYTSADHENISENVEGSSTGVLVQELDEKTMYVVLVAQRNENDLVPYATDAKKRCGGWPQLGSEDLRNQAPWGQNAGKVWAP